MAEFVERRSRIGKIFLGQFAGGGKGERRQEIVTMFNHTRKKTYFTSGRKETKEEVAPQTPSCPECKGFHALWRSRLFWDKPVKNRWEIVKKLRLCFNCFGTHLARNCRSNGSCKKCSCRHHTLLHVSDEGSKDMWRQDRIVQMVTRPEIVLLTWREFLSCKTNKGVFAPQEGLIVQVAERYD